MSLLGGHCPQPHRGTLTPFVPLSLEGRKGEGEIRIEAHVRALHARGPLIQYWVEGRWDGFRLSAAGMTEGVGVSTIVAQGEAFKIPRGASGWEGGVGGGVG